GERRVVVHDRIRRGGGWRVDGGKIVTKPSFEFWVLGFDFAESNLKLKGQNLMLNEFLPSPLNPKPKTQTQNRMQGPAIFLAQFVREQAPFNTLEGICRWAAALGYKGVQIPAWEDPRF